MLADSIRLGPFELHGRVGRGGMGEVWKGVHVQAQVPVAVKLLHGKEQAPGATLAFQHEVRQVAMLDHPNVVLVFDYGQVTEADARRSEGRLAGGSDYLVMEYASLGSLDAVAELSWRDVRATLLAVLDALAYTHAHGLLHRDIKPGNVLVAGASDLRPGIKLADFGIAHAISEGPQQRSRAGTPAYMAPEQIRGNWRDFGPWTDLYAVGCLAWKLVTGGPPYLAQDAGRVMRAHLSAPVPPLLPRIAVPEGLERWILTLLQKNPRDRYPFAADAAHALRRLGGATEPADAHRRTGTASTQSDATFAFDSSEDVGSHPTLNPAPEIATAEESDPEPLPVSPAPLPANWRGGSAPRAVLPRLVGAGLGLYGLRTVPLAGRIPERDRLWQRLRGVARAQQARAIVLQGPSGVGKSRLARWLGERAHEVGGAHVLETGYDARPGPNQGLGRLILEALRGAGLSGPELHERARAHLAARGVSDPYEASALVRLAAPADGGPEAPLQPAERNAVVARLLARVAWDRPAVVLLDDVQWGAEALQLVRHVLDNPVSHPVPIVFVLTVRAEALALRTEEAGLLEALCARPMVDVLDVGPLRQQDQSVLVQTLLGLEPRVAELVERRTAGNPLFAIQLVGDWVRRGVLVVVEDGFALRPGERAELPEDLFAVWQGRIEELLVQLDPAARGALWVAGALGREVDDAEWKEASAAYGAEVPDGLLPALLRLRFIETRPGGWSFVHAMLRETVELLVRSAGEWPRLNAACAAMLEGRSGRGVQERWGRHLVEAGSLEAALAPLAAGAEERLAESAYRAARELLDLLDSTFDRLELVPEARPRVEAALLRVRAHIGEGDFVAAEALAARVAETGRRARDKASQGEALRYRGMIAVKRGDLSLAEAMLLQAQLLATQTGQRDEVARATYHYGELLRIRGDLDGAADAFTDALEVFRELEDLHGCADCEVALAAAFDRRGDTPAGETHRRAAIALFERIGNQFGIGSSWNTLGDSLRHRGDYAGAEVAYREALLRFERIGTQARMVPIGNLGLLLLSIGRWEEAAERLQTLLGLATQMGRKVLAAYGHVGLLCHVGRAADWEGWDRHLAAADTLIQESGAVDRDFADYLDLAARLATDAGDPTRAAQAAALAAAQRRQLGEHAPGPRP